MTVHILKLCVGIESVEHLREVRLGRKTSDRPRLPDGRPCDIHVTRFMPKRADEVLDGGSLYWVIKGFVQVRQRIIGLEPVQSANGVKCQIIMDPELVRTESQPRRPHQGWRYLEPGDAPRDLPEGAGDADLPAALRSELQDLGLL